MDKKVELLNEWIFFDNNNMLRKSVWRAKKHATWRKNAFRSGRKSVAWGRDSKGRVVNVLSIPTLMLTNLGLHISEMFRIIESCWGSRKKTEGILSLSIAMALGKGLQKCKGKGNHEIGGIKVNGELMLAWCNSVCTFLGELLPRSKPSVSWHSLRKIEEIPPLKYCESEECRARFKFQKSPDWDGMTDPISKVISGHFRSLFECCLRVKYFRAFCKTASRIGPYLSFGLFPRCWRGLWCSENILSRQTPGQVEWLQNWQTNELRLNVC